MLLRARSFLLPLVSGHAQIPHVDKQVSKLAVNQYTCTTYLYALSGRVHVKPCSKMTAWQEKRTTTSIFQLN